MARRRDGRELFEIFRETKAAQGSAAQPQVPYVTAEQRGQPRTPPLHTLRLGDRHQVEVFMSLGWVYGIAFFVFLALVGAFILGRRTAPEPEPAPPAEAPASFADEAGPVTASRPPAEQRESPVTAGEAPQPEPEEPEAPAPVTTQGLYTLRVATYQNVSAQRQQAEDFVAWLKEKGYDAQMVVSKSGKSLYVTIGSFETTRSEEARKLLSEVRSLKYKSASFADAFYQNVNTL